MSRPSHDIDGAIDLNNQYKYVATASIYVNSPRVFDGDNSGNLTRSEFKDLIFSLGIKAL